MSFRGTVARTTAARSTALQKEGGGDDRGRARPLAAGLRRHRPHPTEHLFSSLCSQVLGRTLPSLISWSSGVLPGSSISFCTCRRPLRVSTAALHASRRPWRSRGGGKGKGKSKYNLNNGFLLSDKILEQNDTEGLGQGEEQGHGQGQGQGRGAGAGAGGGTRRVLLVRREGRGVST